jgi:hypothetical protein
MTIKNIFNNLYHLLNVVFWLAYYLRDIDLVYFPVSGGIWRVKKKKGIKPPINSLALSSNGGRE